MPNKKKNLDAPVTLRDFREFVDFAVKTFATKDDLNQLDSKIDIKLDRLEEKLENKLMLIKDEILSSNDQLAKKLDIDATERIMTIAGLDPVESRSALRGWQARNENNKAGKAYWSGKINLT